MGVGAVVVDPLLGAGVVASVVLIGAVSAAASLRKVAVTPLGVRTRSEAPAKRTTAFVVGGVLIVGVVMLVSNLGALGQLLGRP